MKYKTAYHYLSFITLLIFSCQGDEGQPGINSLFTTAQENAGSNCSYGGIRIEYGLDKDRNDILSADEVQNKTFVCNGKDGVDGTSYLFDVLMEDNGANCQYGGYKLMSGLDTNKNGILDSDEKTNTLYICSSKNYLVSSNYENPGQNCTDGGYKLNGGLDLNNNNKLDGDEIVSTQYICNGISDGITRLEIPSSGANTTSTSFVVTGNLIDFNKLDYKTDSIVFVSDPYTSGQGNSVIVELYNLTDDTPISGGELSTTATFNDRAFLFSENVYDNLPNKKISIGVRTKSSVNGQFAANSYTGLFIFIYKK